MAAPRISVIIPHYGDLARLDLCLAALERQTLPRRDFEVVVADNASPEGEAAVAAVIAGRARLVVVTERGAGPARNGGVAASRGEVLAFTDSDCVPEPAWLAEGLAALAVHDFVGGRVKVLVNDERHMTGPEAFERVFAFDFETYITRKGFTGSGNMFCPRCLFDKVGGFRVGVSEDTEWCERARAAGFRLGYAPEAIVGHPARRTWAELVRKWRRVNTEAFGLRTSKPHGRLWWAVRSLLLPVSAVAHTPRVLASKDISSPRQKALATAVLFRLRLWRFANSMRLLLEPPRT